jgi:single-stranded-DNA-specific exonuclease
MLCTLRPADVSRATGLGRALGVSPAIAQVLLHRGVDDEAQARAFLAPKLASLTPPDAMADRELAARRLARAIEQREHVVVFGDYDVDGTTSAAVLSGILEQLGARVSVRLASRFDGGYGLSDAAVDRLLPLEPGVLVTCDCGSSDHPRLERLRARGIDVIVVDHHLVPEAPLPVLAFLNPNRPECGFGFKSLCSAGLALSLGAAVRAVLSVSLDLRCWLDLVALGTIADVVPLRGDNRSLVRAGLALLASPDARPGIVALRESARIAEGAAIGAIDAAFRLTPRLNAAGRLGEQELTLQLLRARTLPEARALAARIEQLNDQRKAIEAEVTSAAVAQVLERHGEHPSSGVVAAGQGWHRGVIGISAARVSERFGVPAIVIGLDGEHGHGSGRAPDGVRLFDAVQACAAPLERFGGHQVALGLSVCAGNVPAFRERFEEVTRTARAEGAAPLAVDVAIGEGAFERLPAASDLCQLEPLGEGNEEPTFLLERALVDESRTVGDGHLKLKLRVGEQRLGAFGYALAARRPEPGSTIRIAGPLRPDTWGGATGIELRITDFEVAGG